MTDYGSYVDLGLDMILESSVWAYSTIKHDKHIIIKDLLQL